jgi:hypothetical protein
MTDFKITGDIPVPAAPSKRGRSPNNKDIVPDNQGQQGQLPTKSHLKIVEELTAEAAPVADPLNRPALNPFDPALLRIDPRNETIAVKREIINISVRKPSKFEPFRTHPTLRINVMLCMPKKGAHEGEVFLVATTTRDLLVQHVVSATLFFLMTAEGAPLVAPVPFPEEGGKEHAAHSSFRIIAARAEKQWCLAIYKKPTSSYELGTQDTDFGEPVWPDLTLAEVLEKAFRDCYIKDRTHPFVKYVGLGLRA